LARRSDDLLLLVPELVEDAPVLVDGCDERSTAGFAVRDDCESDPRLGCV